MTPARISASGRRGPKICGACRSCSGITACSAQNASRMRRAPWRPRCGLPDGYCCGEAVTLLASAALDEYDGLEGALGSVLAWFGDGKRFCTSFVRAMRSTVAALRRELSGSVWPPDGLFACGVDADPTAATGGSVPVLRRRDGP